MQNKKLSVAAVVVGIACVAVAALYWLTPAGNLPSFMPGFAAGSATIHFKHGLAALIVAALLFVYAWFASAKKAS